jgi:hypothetical protein
VTSSVDAGCKSLISICFSKIAGAMDSLKFLGGKEESMACALRRYGVTMQVRHRNVQKNSNMT